MLDQFVIIGVILIAGCNYLFTGWFIKFARLHRITDVPSERSSHSVPTPRGGGIGFVVISIAGFTIYFTWTGLIGSAAFITMLITLSAIAYLGWLDDKTNLSQNTRLSIQIIVAASIILFVESLNSFYLPYVSTFSLGFFSPFLGLLWITGVTNIYNFMDGVDGIASVQALSASAGWMIIAGIWNEPVLFTVNLIIFAAITAFLLYNWSPAKIFMGDVGSVYLGFFFAIMPFLAAAMAEEHSIGMTLWIGAILLWPFLFDSTYTLIRRFLKGENVFRAHRSHLYQRLNIAGWSHSAISILYLIFSILCVFITLLFINGNDSIQAILIAGLLILSLLYVVTVQQIEKEI